MGTKIVPTLYSTVSRPFIVDWLAALCPLCTETEYNSFLERSDLMANQVLGGMGHLQPYGLDRLSRLAQMLRIVDGTTEISRVVIGRALQKRAASLPDLAVRCGFGEGEDAVAQ